MIVTDSQFRDWLEFLTAVSTLIAVLFAAVSAWTSRLSAKAAHGAVKEARLARRTELAPKLILEKEFLDFIFSWPHADSLNGEAVFLARKHWRDKSPTAPTFILQNFGQSPAIEVTIVWNLDDPNGEFQLPSGYERLGLSLEDGFASEEQGTIKNLVYAKRDGNGACGLPLYRKWTTDIPSCSPGQKRVVEFPALILNTLFLRGLQLGASASDSDIILTAEISCYAVDAVRHKSQFCWKAIPFHYGQTNPIVVYGHFFELPIHPKPEGSRVA